MDRISKPGDAVLHKLYSINTIAAQLDDKTIEELIHDPAIKSVTANCIVQLDPIETETDMVANGVSAALSWGLDRIDSRTGTDGVYDDSGATGSGALVYVLDTGVRISHDDFRGRAEPGWSAGCPTGSESLCGNDRTGWLHQGVITDADSRCHGHGTHCASTVGGADYGVAKGVTIITVQVLSCGGSGSGAGVMAGIEWAINDAKQRGLPAVLSMSLGGGGSNRYDGVIGAAHEAGLLTVVAAGNDNGDACNKSPASTALAVTVGSIDEGDSKSSFSNWGTCVDIHAPGRSITAAWVGSNTDTKTISGTSMATPHVAGVAAQLRARQPTMDPTKITDALLCLSTKGIVSGLRSDTANTLLFNNLNAQDAGGCFMPAPPSPPPSPPSPPPPPSPLPSTSPPSTSPPPPSPSGCASLPSSLCPVLCECTLGCCSSLCSQCCTDPSPSPPPSTRPPSTSPPSTSPPSTSPPSTSPPSTRPPSTRPPWWARGYNPSSDQRATPKAAKMAKSDPPPEFEMQTAHVGAIEEEVVSAPSTADQDSRALAHWEAAIEARLEIVEKREAGEASASLNASLAGGLLGLAAAACVVGTFFGAVAVACLSRSRQIPRSHSFWPTRAASLKDLKQPEHEVSRTGSKMSADV